MSVAIIQGASGGLGLNLAAHILRHTSLKVYALTHQSSTTDLQRHLEQSDSNLKDRLTVLGGIDNTAEDTLSKAAKTLEEREGKASVRLIACLAGIVCPPLISNSIEVADSMVVTSRKVTIGFRRKSSSGNIQCQYDRSFIDIQTLCTPHTDSERI